jgi:hypothetical protein
MEVEGFIAQSEGLRVEHERRLLQPLFNDFVAASGEEETSEETVKKCAEAITAKEQNILYLEAEEEKLREQVNIVQGLL